MDKSNKIKNRNALCNFIKFIFCSFLFIQLGSCAHKNKDRQTSPSNESSDPKNLKDTSPSPNTTTKVKLPKIPTSPVSSNPQAQVVPLKTFPAFIDDEDLDQHLNDLKQLSKDAYEYANMIDPDDRPQPRPQDAERLRAMDESGELKSFDGIETDGFYDKSTGFILFDAKKELITIVFHGTRSGKRILTNLLSKNPFLGTQGWSTNLDQALMTVDDLEFHRGFYYKYFRKDTPSGLSIGEQIDKIAESIFKEWEKDPLKTRKNVRIRVTGHSQGAAMAAIAIYDLSKRLKEGKLWNLGKEDNAQSNRVVAYLLSPPSVTASLPTLNAMNALLDPRNAIAEYYQEDIVTNTPVAKNEIRAYTQVLGIYVDKNYRHPLVQGYHYFLPLPENLAKANTSFNDRLMVLHFASKVRLGYYDPEVVPKVNKALLVAPMRMDF